MGDRARPTVRRLSYPQQTRRWEHFLNTKQPAPSAVSLPVVVLTRGLKTLHGKLQKQTIHTF